MDLTVHIPDEAVPALRAKASGLPLETFAEQVLLERIHDADTKTPDSSVGAGPPRRHIWDVIAENMKRVPPEDFAALPKDGLRQIDHYVYGVPKRTP